MSSQLFAPYPRGASPREVLALPTRRWKRHGVTPPSGPRKRAPRLPLTLSSGFPIALHIREWTKLACFLHFWLAQGGWP